MSEWLILSLGVLTVAVLALVIAAWRDVRVARWTARDPRRDREARRSAAKQVRSSGEGQG